ncbi:MAG TPA: DoxX family membrane protein [Candidatus Paceibacterota bacterium]
MKEELKISKFLFRDTKISFLWFLIRLYLGYEWISAGMGKIISPAWVGPDAGSALSGFVNKAVAKSVGEHPDVSAWFAGFLKAVILPQPQFWSHVVAFGELAVGIGLILGVFTFAAAFFGGFMNLNYLLAGSVSINPAMLLLSIGLLLAWRIAGYIGADKYLMPFIGLLLKRKREEVNN